jgi:hypothetical protein
MLRDKTVLREALYPTASRRTSAAACRWPAKSVPIHRQTDGRVTGQLLGHLGMDARTGRVA